jgi:hypothetical protein
MPEKTEKRELMSPEDFNKFFALVLKDEAFRCELARDGFGALERHGFKATPPPEIRASLAQMLARPMRTGYSQCGFCGICGLCTLCGEINAGSGSAFLWATFFLGELERI